MLVTYASAARRDLNAIIDYISLEDRAAAERVFYAMSAVCPIRASFP